ncbi:MAG: hypothetical protein ACRENE_33190 [Polyangiaceae bacterium]
MNAIRGPTRIMLLRSAQYDYAEVDLREPVHLVAPNNTGKTSFIAALQLLYIDDVRQMHFSHPLSETRRHYFPTSDSFVLFECMTATGFQVMGARGLGPVQGYEFERFVYRGAYEHDDFRSGRELRRWQEIRSRLVPKDLVLLEPKNIRATLTASGDAKGPPLGLVPLTRSGNYDTFRFLFRNLLRLSRIEQTQLKQLFIDIARPRLRFVELDLRNQYAELYTRVDREAEAVRALRSVADTIAGLIEAFRERQNLRRRLTASWDAIDAGLRAEKERVEQHKADTQRKAEKLESEAVEIEGKGKDLEAQAREVVRQQQGVVHRLEELDRLADQVGNYLPELEAAGREQLGAALDDVIGRLRQAAMPEDDRQQVEERLEGLNTTVRRLGELESRFGDAVVTWLRTHSRLTEPELNDAFRLLDARLLERLVEPSGVEILDEPRLVRLLRRIADAFADAGFEAEGIRIQRSALTAGAPLSRYEDIEAVRDRRMRAMREAEQLRATLEDIANREALQERRDVLERQLAEARTREQEWLRWQELEVSRTIWTAERDALSTTIAGLDEQRDTLGRRLTEARRQSWELDNAQKAVVSACEDLARRVQRLTPAPASWGTPGEPIPEGQLDDEIRFYETTWADHGRIANRFDRAFKDVEQDTKGKYIGKTEAETVTRLEDEVQALSNRESSVQQLWTSLVEDMKNAFKALVDAVEELKREVSRLNRALGVRRISNLERVELELIPQRDLVRRLTAVVDADAMPLFAGGDGQARATREVARWLEERPRIELAELFDLRFTIVDQAGRSKNFESLSQIESQGTSTTIKVLVHLELLRAMLTAEKVSVPFFLDEVATLDDRNLRALVDHAVSMGFVPVIASPEARDCVDALYFLTPSASGMVLDEHCRMSIDRGNAE